MSENRKRGWSEWQPQCPQTRSLHRQRKLSRSSRHNTRPDHGRRSSHPCYQAPDAPCLRGGSKGTNPTRGAQDHEFTIHGSHRSLPPASHVRQVDSCAVFLHLCSRRNGSRSIDRSLACHVWRGRLRFEIGLTVIRIIQTRFFNYWNE